jgi:hypothetical protein
VVEFTHGVKTRAHSTVFGVDNIHSWGTHLYERNMIVNDVGVVLEKVPSMAWCSAAGAMRTCSELLEPFSRATFSSLPPICRGETIPDCEKRFRLPPAFALDVYSRRDRRSFEIVDRLFHVGPDQPDLHPGLLMSDAPSLAPINPCLKTMS